MATVDRPGNLLLDLFCGSEIHFVPKRMPFEEGIRQRQESLAADLLSKSGERALCIPIGGSNATGAFGYVEAWHEMVGGQGLLDTCDDVVVTCGSGGTAAGLAIGNYLTGGRVRVHAVSVSDDSGYFHAHVDAMLAALGAAAAGATDAKRLVGHRTTPIDDRFPKT